FREHPNWKVIAIDNNPILLPHVHGMILADVHQTIQTYTIIERLLLESFEHIQQVVVWMSPPCTEFSYANAQRPDEPDLTLLLDGVKIRDMIGTLCDEHGIECLWAVENVKGAIPWFDEELETPWHQRVGPMYLWGNIPWIDFIDAKDREFRKGDSNKGSRALRPNLRALVPYSMSKSLLDSLEKQRTLHDY
ncbi:unnamed protein product, partial [marine sediment metagenome]